MSRATARRAEITIDGPVNTASLSALRFEARELTADGVQDLTVNIDAAGTLENALTATLIHILRDVRSRSGSLTIAAGQELMLDGLRLTALDRIVAVVPPTGAARAA
ncbi:MAG: hypothetical protein GIW95_06470 [Candidatus Eremiobacteraeota bacterium]|nr:hypothetical protein [Candidatus Eremiobacteraeota bacterium]